MDSTAATTTTTTTTTCSGDNAHANGSSSIQSQRAQPPPLLPPPSRSLSSSRIRKPNELLAKVPLMDASLTNARITLDWPSRALTFNSVFSVDHTQNPHILQPSSSEATTQHSPTSPTSPFVFVEPPSPTPTEPVTEDEQSPRKAPDSLSVTLAQHHIKVRDFAFEPNPSVIPASVVTNPLLDLMEYDNILFESPRTRPVPGRTLRRLRDIDWVTEREAESDWLEMDWQALREFDAKGRHLWRPSRVVKPSDQEREEGKLQRAKVLGTLRGRIRTRTAPAQPPLPVAAVPSNAEPPGHPDKGKKRAHAAEVTEEDKPNGATSALKRCKPSPETSPTPSQVQSQAHSSPAPVRHTPPSAAEKAVLARVFARTFSSL